jgi:hypothetical protein
VTPDWGLEMSQAKVDPSCPLCWKNGKLAGGRVLAETDALFAYAFFNDGGGLKYALIVPKEHYDDMTTLPAYWGDEFGPLYVVVLSRMPDGQPHNGYWNVGYTAGQRVMGHWHVRIEPRNADEPASDMGLNLLLTKYNSVLSGLAKIAATCNDPALAAQLRELIVK